MSFSKLRLSIGSLGTVGVGLSGAKFLWEMADAGGNVQFITQFLPWLWAQLDKPYFLYPTFIAGVLMIVWAVRTQPRRPIEPKETHSANAESATQFQAFPEGLEVMYVAALQIVSMGSVLETDLDSRLKERGFDPPPNCLDAVIKRTGLVRKTFDGRGEVMPEFRASLTAQLPKLKLRGSAERKLKERVEALERENEELKAMEQYARELEKLRSESLTATSSSKLEATINPRMAAFLRPAKFYGQKRRCRKRRKSGAGR